MDALEFAKERSRLCSYYKEKLNEQDCSNCPLFNDRRACHLGARLDNEDDYKNIIAIVEQWAKEHPAKTRQSEFLKMFPCESLIEEDTGVLDIYPCNLGFIYDHGKFKAKCCSADMCPTGRTSSPVGICEDCRKKFWAEEIEND